MSNTGITIFDNILSRGYSGITMIYGPAASGKTTCCKLSAIASKDKVIYIDTEGGFNAERFSQLAGNRDKGALARLILLRIKTYDEQIRAIQGLEEMAGAKGIGLIIIDTLGSIYRMELKKDAYKANKAMHKQLDMIEKVSKKVPVLIANQVYQNFEKHNAITPVGGEMVKKRCDCLIELEKDCSDRFISIVKVQSHDKDDLDSYIKVPFEIKETGIYMKKVI